MKTYKEFMQESSMSRLKAKADKGGTAIMTTSRKDKSRKNSPLHMAKDAFIIDNNGTFKKTTEQINYLISNI